MEELYQFEEEYRDTLATVDQDGKRIWINPKKPRGRHHNYRIGVTIVLLTLLFSGPFITIGGHPLLLLNVFARKFVILGQPFWPQDFFLFALLLIILFVFIILFTVAFGRIWCGWACPQTLFMEMVFRKIEYVIEGDANQQRKLKKAPWDKSKILKKGTKHLIFIAIAFLISHTVMAYLIGIEETLVIVQGSPLDNPSGFIGLLAFTGIFYWVFAVFREQACVAVCPYGRLQSVLLVKDSLVVAYDWIRGEPRGKIKNTTSDPEVKGDCIDCKLCVHVCPTGIDIRNGTQLECVNCTACIDACDDVMVKIKKPTGLIKIASFNSIKNGVANLLNSRTIAYSIVMIALIFAFGYLLTTRSDVETTVLKVPGQLYQTADDGQISNLYNLQFLNKTFDEKRLTISLESGSHASIEQVGQAEIVIQPNELYKSVFFIKIPPEKIRSVKSIIRIIIKDESGEIIEEVKTKFLGPVYN